MTFEKHRENWVVEQCIISVEIQDGAVDIETPGDPIEWRL